MLVFGVAVGVALVVSFLCSIFESALLSISHADVEALELEGRRSGRILKGFKRNIDVPIAAILIANTVAHTVGSAVAGASYEDAFSEGTLWLFTIIFTIVVLLFTEIIPKTLGVSYAQGLAAPVAYGIRTLTLVLRPFVAVAESLSRSLRGKKELPPTSLEEIRLLALLGRSEGVVGARTANMIVGATRLRELRVRDVMVPRRLVTYLSGTRSREEILATMGSSRHSRFPFSPTDELDQVSGIVLAKDLLFHMQENPSGEIAWSKLVRKPIMVPGSKLLNDLLRTFQESHIHMVMVVDEYGGVDGIVTLEDVIEEVVGEIIDESDRPQEMITRLPDGSLRTHATMGMREVCQELGVDWVPEPGVTSVGGLVARELGRLPERGDEVEWQGFRFRVLAAGPRRPERIAIVQVPPSPEVTPEGQE